ncbi:MAG: PEP-CTERM sorting domain-containing protein [Nitrospiraceae bacterium]
MTAPTCWGATLTGEILPGPAGTTSIDTWFFTILSPGPLYVTPVLVDISVVDISVSPFDPEINLFRDDGSLDLADFIANNDDFGVSRNSMINASLQPGSYLLRISGFNFGNDDGTDSEILGIVNPPDLLTPSGGSTGFYFGEIATRCQRVFPDEVEECSAIGSFGRESEVGAVPEPASLMLLGSGLAGLGLWRSRHS